MTATDHYTRRGALPRAGAEPRLTALRRNGETFTIELRVSQISHHGERRFIGRCATSPNASASSG